MAKLRAGILGQVSGKVSGVVGGTWKDKNYVREYVIPANPNTAAQQTQRGLFGRAVDFCKQLVGPIFNVYTDKFQTKMSGYNYFVKRNIKEFTDPPSYENVLISEGKLFSAESKDEEANSTFNTFNFDWEVGLGSNGKDDDKIYMAAYNSNTGRWGFSAAEGVRSLGALGASVALEMTAGDVIKSYLVTAQYVGTTLDIISNSFYASTVAADV